MYIEEIATVEKFMVDEEDTGNVDQLSLNIGSREEVKPVYEKKRTGSSKSVAGPSGIDRIVVFFDNGTYEEFTSSKDA